MKARSQKKAKSQKLVKVRYLDENIRKDVKRYVTLKCRKESIEDQMRQIRSRLTDYLGSLDTDCLEDTYWKVRADTVHQTSITKDNFIRVYGESALSRVSTKNEYTRITVTRKK